jgi:hypothetical protein
MYGSVIIKHLLCNECTLIKPKEQRERDLGWAEEVSRTTVFQRNMLNTFCTLLSLIMVSRQWRRRHDAKEKSIHLFSCYTTTRCQPCAGHRVVLPYARRQNQVPGGSQMSSPGGTERGEWIS